MSRFNNETYMRQAFEDIIQKYGHTVYLQRRKSDNTYENNLEIHKVRFSVTASRALPGVAQETTEGLVNTSERIYYFRYDAQPYQNDRIYEVEPRPEGHRVIFTIDVAVPMYGIGGNLVYWLCGATKLQ